MFTPTINEMPSASGKSKLLPQLTLVRQQSLPCLSI